MLQTAVVSRITLLSGSADIILLILITWSLQEQVDSSVQWALLAGLMAVFVSGLSPIVYLLTYLVTVLFARYLLKQTWQTPILAMFAVTFFATLFEHLVTYIVLIIGGASISFGDSIALVTLPSIFLNFLMVLPVNSLISDFALWVYPSAEMI
ncbi:MAG: hypothetical protein WCP19_04715 [Chloroflexota bacterium]